MKGSQLLPIENNNLCFKRNSKWEINVFLYNSVADGHHIALKFCLIKKNFVHQKKMQLIKILRFERKYLKVVYE